MKKVWMNPSIDELNLSATAGQEVNGNELDQAYINNTSGETWKTYYASGEHGNFDLPDPTEGDK